MSKRWEFLEEGAELIVGPDDLLEEFGQETYDDGVGDVALVMGNPWATAAVLCGTRESIAATLRQWLALVENDGKWPYPDVLGRTDR
jgi:hypothetical protein